MTREEAIKMLKSKLYEDEDTSYEWIETVRMAINALERTENYKNKIEDLYNRLNIAEEYNACYKKEIETLETEIRALKNEQTNGDLISREEAKELVCKFCDYYGVCDTGMDNCLKLKEFDKLSAHSSEQTEIIKNHGRLIDADELLKELGSEHIGGIEAIKKYHGENTWEDGLHTAWRLIDEAPTVVAEKAEQTDLSEIKALLYNIISMMSVEDVKLYSDSKAKIQITPKAEQTYDWCNGCQEYDTEKHCCHRYSSFIRESLQDSINAVLEDIKAELKKYANHEVIAISGGEESGLDIAIGVLDKHISN